MACEVLSSPEARNEYDNFGIEKAVFDGNDESTEQLGESNNGEAEESLEVSSAEQGEGLELPSSVEQEDEDEEEEEDSQGSKLDSETKLICSLTPYQEMLIHSLTV